MALNVRSVKQDTCKRHGKQLLLTIPTFVNLVTALDTRLNATMMPKLTRKSYLWTQMAIEMEEEFAQTVNTTRKESTATNVRMDSSDPSIGLSMQPMSVSSVTATPSLITDPVLKAVANASANQTTNLTTVLDVLLDTMTSQLVESVTVT